MKSNTNKVGIFNKETISRKLFLLAAFVFVLGVCFFANACKPRPKAYIQKFKGSRYRLMVDQKPYIVKGVCYNPIPIGQNHEYDWWSSPYKPWIIDGKLMQEMGINTVRFYQPGENPEAVKKVVRDLYQLYGIRTIMGHWLGFWEYPCPLYGDKEFQERIKKDVLDMVNLYKDEPGILMWVLGNENNYSCFGRVNPWSSDEIDKECDPRKQNEMRIRTFYSYVNDIAKEIHKIDPNHPVALGNGELLGLECAAKYCPDVDLVGCIIYRGKSFGNIFKSLKTNFDKPLLLLEFGADSYNAYEKVEDPDMQSFFLEAQWRQIYQNMYPYKEGEGNCLGGVMFEWTDEWWKHNEAWPEGWAIHDTESNWSNGSYYFDIKVEGNKNMNEEWFGIVGLSDQMEDGINKRAPRKGYYVIRDFWKNPTFETKKKKK